MDAVVHTDVAEFDALTKERYARDPAWHTIAITVLHRIQANPDAARPAMVSFHEDGELVGTVLRADPWPVQTTDLPVDAVALAVETVRRADPAAPGVVGPEDLTRTFAELWSDTARVKGATRLYRLDELRPADAPGAVRFADESDVPLLARWRELFDAEANPGEPPGRPAAELVRRSLALGDGHAIWEVGGEPVAWAAAGAPTAGMSRIAPVYTPPEHRRNGYGAAVSAAVSQWVLDAGAEHVVLFADLGNPVSNSIYQRIGFRAVADWVEYRW